jgi:hypothetical protein
MRTTLLEINPKLNVIIMSDYFVDLKCNYKFNILKKHVYDISFVPLYLKQDSNSSHEILAFSIASSKILSSFSDKIGWILLYYIL